MNLIQEIRNYTLKKSRNTTYRPADYKGFEKLKKLAMVFESGEQDDTVKAFAQHMRDNGKEVSVLAYIPQRRKEISYAPGFAHFTKDELNWLGRPKSAEVQNFLKEPYEVFITLNERLESPIQFITVAAQADFIIGLRKGKETRIDLQFESGANHNYAQIFKEIEYYLRFINR